MNWAHMTRKILISRGGFMVQSPVINWDHNPTTLSTSTYGLGLSNESNLTTHITSLTLMASGFFNKSPYLHKMTTKPEVRHLIFGL